MVEHKHAIIIIKNNNNEFLQYYDNRWNSFLFLNCKLKEETASYDVVSSLINKLKISKDCFKCEFLFDKIHTKYSESAKINKTYHHYFYNVYIDNMPSIMQQKEFFINNVKFSWYSLEELKKDERIKEVNSDIVGFISELNIM